MDIKAIEKLAHLIKSHGKSKPQIIFLNGAGISTSCGIPDFRTPGTGLYDNLSKLNLPYAEAVFDIEFFENDPKPFYILAKELYPGQFKPSKYHYFIRYCQDEQMLQRCYTQNIDTLERLTGLDHDKIIEAHGSFNNNHCIKCHKSMSVLQMSDYIQRQIIPRCKQCGSGIFKPDIVFFGEALPDLFWQQWDKDVIDEPDFLIVCGTSLSVYPFAGLPAEISNKVVRVLINKELVGDFKENPRKDDVVILGDIDEIISKLVELLDWSDDFEKLIATNDTLFKEKKLTLHKGSPYRDSIEKDVIKSEENKTDEKDVIKREEDKQGEKDETKSEENKKQDETKSEDKKKDDTKSEDELSKGLSKLNI